MARVISNLIGSVLLGSGVASGQFVTPQASGLGWERGVTVGSVYAEWDRFVSPFRNPAPDVGMAVSGVLSDASGDFAFNVVDVTGASFVTSTRNLYSIDVASEFEVTVPGFGLGDGYTTTVVLQVRVLGVEIAPGSVRIGEVGPESVTELSRGEAVEGIGFGGVDVSTRYVFELEGSAAGQVIEFAASGPSMSLARVAVDTFVEELAVSGPAGCNPADLSATPPGSGDFGQLDGNDIGAFVTGFIAGDLTVADLSATPPDSGDFGQLDGNDIGAFVTAFLAGCGA